MPTPSDTTKSPAGRQHTRFSRYAVAAAALAASFLVGVFVGPRLFDRHREPEFAFNKLETRGDVTRGIEDVQLLVTNDGDARAFVTVVGLGPGIRGAEVYARGGGNFLVAPPHETIALKGLPPRFEQASVVIVVLTSVPAADIVLATVTPEANPGRADETAERLRAALTGYGIRAETRVVPLPTSKK